MEKFGTYKILKEEGLVIEYHSGDIKINEFIESRKSISSDPEYNSDFDHIFDFRDVNMVVNQEDIKKFIAFFKKFHPIIGNRKSAYLTSKPNEVVITTLFSIEIKGLSIHPQTFSTIEGALSWINNKGINSRILLQIIKNLKTQSNLLYKSGQVKK